MTDRATVASLANGEYTGFAGAARDSQPLPDGPDHASGTFEGRCSGLSEFELSYLSNIRQYNCLPLDGMRHSLTGATAWQVMRGLAGARTSMLDLQVSRGFSYITQIEPTLGDLSPLVAAKVRGMVDLLRAIGLALQDDTLAALSFAQSAIKQIGESRGSCAATTICRLAYWKLGDLDSFFSLPRSRTASTTGRRGTICDIFDLSIEAAVEFDQLRLSSAKHLAQDAFDLAVTASNRRPALAALPASLLAQLFYEQGSLEDAEAIIRSHLPVIKAGGCIESAIRAYPLLARIVSRRGQRDRAISILKESEELAEQRGWCRLTAVSLAERANLLLETDRAIGAQAYADILARLATSAGTGPSRARTEIHRIWTLVQARITLAQTPSRSAVAALRQLQHDAVIRRSLYEALHLAVLLVGALEIIGEESEAIVALIRTLTLGSTVGAYQVFLDGGDRVWNLLTLVYDRARSSDNNSRELLPYIGSLLHRKSMRETPTPFAPAKSSSAGTLSERELITVIWMSRGLSNKEIAKQLKVTPETVKTHAKNIYFKLAVKTRAEAVSRANGLGLI